MLGDCSPEGLERRRIELVGVAGFVVLETGGKLVGVRKDPLRRCVAWSSPQVLFAGPHGVDDDDGGGALDVADLQDDGGSVRSDEHRAPIAEVPCSDWMSVGVQDVVLRQAVRERGLRDERIVRLSVVDMLQDPRARRLEVCQVDQRVGIE